jgi:endonuclease-8
VPEGDTIFRAAATLQHAMAGKVITGVDTTVPQVRRLMPERLVGQTVERVEARGKHLLHWFDPSGLALHTHMRMTGSWHTYPPGGRWRKPAHFAKLVLRTADVEAVAFSVPVVELLSAAQVATHRSMANLGPDPLHVPEGEQLDLAESRKRLDTLADTPIGVALLDQRVLAGVGNVYKNEVLFICRVDPWTPVAEVPPRGARPTAGRVRRAAAGQHRPRRVRPHHHPTPCPGRTVDRAPARVGVGVGLRQGRPSVPPLRDPDQVGRARRSRARDVLVHPMPGARASTTLIRTRDARCYRRTSPLG